MVFLYPYPYQTFNLIITAVILLSIAIPLYILYKFLTKKLNRRSANSIKTALKIAGFIFIVLFLMEMTLSIINIRLMNKQMGFSYSTPELPEGEFLIIKRIEPGNIMDVSGLKVNDRVNMDSVSELYRLLKDNQGNEVSIQIIRNNKEETINVNVPDLELYLERLSFWF